MPYLRSDFLFRPIPPSLPPMRILPYTDALAPAFRDINAAWITDMFVLEPHDEHVLAHPRQAIVDPGGAILFVATPRGEVVGTGALMPTEPGVFELTKMGVTAQARGTGAGALLLAATDDGAIVGTGALMPTEPGACELTKMGVLAAARGTGAGAALLAALIECARDLPGIDTLYLLTSHKCEAAIHLYERAGFVHDAGIMARFGASYARCDVAMRYPLDAPPVR